MINSKRSGQRISRANKNRAPGNLGGKVLSAKKVVQDDYGYDDVEDLSDALDSDNENNSSGPWIDTDRYFIEPIEVETSDEFGPIITLDYSPQPEYRFILTKVPIEQSVKIFSHADNDTGVELVRNVDWDWNAEDNEVVLRNRDSFYEVGDSFSAIYPYTGDWLGKEEDDSVCGPLNLTELFEGGENGEFVTTSNSIVIDLTATSEDVYVGPLAFTNSLKHQGENSVTSSESALTAAGMIELNVSESHRDYHWEAWHYMDGEKITRSEPYSGPGGVTISNNNAPFSTPGVYLTSFAAGYPLINMYVSLNAIFPEDDGVYYGFLGGTTTRILDAEDVEDQWVKLEGTVLETDTSFEFVNNTLTVGPTVYSLDDGSVSKSIFEGNGEYYSIFGITVSQQGEIIQSTNGYTDNQAALTYFNAYVDSISIELLCK